MAKRTLPGIGLTGFWDLGAAYKTENDVNLQTLSAVVQLSVIDRAVALPGTPTLGDIYIVPDSDPTNPDKVAVWDGPSGSEAWVYLTPNDGWLAYVQAEDAYCSYTTAGGWVVLSTGGGGLSDAPSDGSLYARRDGAWESFVPGAGGGAASPQAFRANITTAQTGLPSGTDTTIVWDNEAFDTEGAYDTATGIFTVPAALDGKYMSFAAAIQVDTGVVDLILKIRKGPLPDDTVAINAIPSTNVINAASGAFLVSAGDTVYVELTPSSGLDIVAGYNSYFAGHVLDGQVGAMTQTEIAVAHTVDDTDLAGNVVRKINLASAGNVTVDPGLTGTEPATYIQAGAGQLTFVAGAGVTINSADGNLKTRAQYSSVTLIPDVDAADTYYLVGDTSA